MFPFKKTGVSKWVSWGRGKVGSVRQRDVGVQVGPAVSLSKGDREAIDQPRLLPSENDGVKIFVLKRPPAEVTDATASSYSEPVMGLPRYPDDFRFESRSLGTFATFPVESRDGDGDSPTIDGNVPVEPAAGPSGLRKRNNKCKPEDPITLSIAAEGVSLNRVSGDGSSSNGGGDMVMVTIGDENAPEISAQPGHPQYAEAYLDKMYAFGTSRYKTKSRLAQENDGWCSAIGDFGTMILFWTVVTWAISDSFVDAKYNFLLFMSGKGMSYFLEFSFNWFCVMTETCGVYRLTLKHKETDRMLEKIEEYGRNYKTQSGCECKYWKWIILCICVGTLVMAAVKAVFDVGFDDWSLDDTTKIKAHKLSEDLFLWSHKNFSNRSNELAIEYGRVVTWRARGMAALSIVMSGASNFQMGTLRDLALVVVFVIFVLLLSLMKGIIETTDNAPKEDAEACRALQARRETSWKQFRKFKEVITATNAVMDDLLKLLHVDNLLLYSFFAALFIERDDISAVTYADYIFNIVKAELTYIFAGYISSQNETVINWIRNWAYGTGKIVVDGEEYDAGMIINELERQPIGFGTGMFHIDPEFHLKFFALAGSVLLFLADEKKKLIAYCISGESVN